MSVGGAWPAPQPLPTASVDSTAVPPVSSTSIYLYRILLKRLLRQSKYRLPLHLNVLWLPLGLLLPVQVMLQTAFPHLLLVFLLIRIVN